MDTYKEQPKVQEQKGSGRRPTETPSVRCKESRMEWQRIGRAMDEERRMVVCNPKTLRNRYLGLQSQPLTVTTTRNP
jgi:hypothetical protein